MRPTPLLPLKSRWPSSSRCCGPRGWSVVGAARFSSANPSVILGPVRAAAVRLSLVIRAMRLGSSSAWACCRGVRNQAEVAA